MLVLGRGGNRRPNKERGQLLLATPSQYFCRICQMANTDEIHNNTSYYTPENLITIDQFSTGRVYYSTSFIFQSPSKNLKDLKYLQKWHPHQCVAFFQNLKYSGFSVTRDQYTPLSVKICFLLWKFQLKILKNFIIFKISEKIPKSKIAHLSLP